MYPLSGVVYKYFIGKFCIFSMLYHRDIETAPKRIFRQMFPVDGYRRIWR
jgi:hypothetical protein